MAQLTTRHEHMQAIAKKFKPVDYELADMWPASKPGCSETFHDANLGIQVRVSEYVKTRSGLSDGPCFGLFTTKSRSSGYEIIAQYVGDRSPAKWMDVHSDYTFEVCHKGKKFVIDARDASVSSVARYVNCGSTFSRNNCVFYNNKGNIYLVRVKGMAADEEFLAPYEKEDDIEKWSLRLEQELVHLVDDSVKQEVMATTANIRKQYLAEVQRGTETLDKYREDCESYKRESEKKMRTVEEAWRQRTDNLEAKVKAMETRLASYSVPSTVPFSQPGFRPALPPFSFSHGTQRLGSNTSNVSFSQPGFRPTLPSHTHSRSPVTSNSNYSSHGTQRLGPGTTHTFKSSVRSKSPHRTPYDRPRSEKGPVMTRSDAGDRRSDRRYSVSSSSEAPAPQSHGRLVMTQSSSALQHQSRSSTVYTRQDPSGVQIKGEGLKRCFSDHPPTNR